MVSRDPSRIACGPTALQQPQSLRAQGESNGIQRTETEGNACTTEALVLSAIMPQRPYTNDLAQADVPIPHRPPSPRSCQRMFTSRPKKKSMPLLLRSGAFGFSLFCFGAPLDLPGIMICYCCCRGVSVVVVWVLTRDQASNKSTETASPLAELHKLHQSKPTNKHQRVATSQHTCKKLRGYGSRLSSAAAYP